MMHQFTTTALFAAILASSAAAQQDREISIALPEGGHLAGTLTLPDGEIDAAAVFVTGSGNHVRDQIISGTPTFAVLANALAENGIASLRIDERGAGQSSGPPAENFLIRSHDVELSLNAMMAELGRADLPVGLIGHSEGAMIAPIVANRNGQVDYVVLLAAPVEPGTDVWVEQQMALSRLETPDLDVTTENRLLAALRGVAETASADTLDLNAVETATVELFRAWGAPDHAFTDGSVPGFASAMAASARRTILQYDPGPALEALDMPVLAVYADGDLQTSPAQNLPGLLDAHRPAGATTVYVLPGADHFFLFLENEPVNTHRFGEMQLLDSLLELLPAWISAQAPAE